MVTHAAAVFGSGSVVSLTAHHQCSQCHSTAQHCHGPQIQVEAVTGLAVLRILGRQLVSVAVNIAIATVCTCVSCVTLFSCCRRSYLFIVTVSKCRYKFGITYCTYLCICTCCLCTCCMSSAAVSLPITVNKPQSHVYVV